MFRHESTQIDDPSSLRKAGTQATEIAGEARTACALPEDETETAAGDFGSGNWDGGLGGALTNLRTTWSSQSGALVATCRDLGTQCTSTADNYGRTETATTEMMQSGVRQSSPFG